MPLISKRSTAFLWVGLLFVFYYVNKGNYFFREIIGSDVLTKIYIDSGELIAEDFTNAIFKGSNFPSFFGLIPSWIYGRFHVAPDKLTEWMGLIQIFIAGTGMLMLAFAANSKNAVLAILCVSYYFFSDIGMVSPTNWANLSRDLQFTSYGIAWVLTAFAAFFHGRFALAAFLLGVTVCFHPAHGALAAAPLFAAFLLTECRKPGATGRLLGMIAAFGAGVAPFLIFVLPKLTILNWSAISPEQMANVASFLKLLFPFHLYPSTWHPSLYLVYAIFLLCSWKGLDEVSENFRSLYRAVFWGYIAILGVSFLFVEVIPVYAVMKLCPFRVTSHLVLISIPPFFLFLQKQMTDSEHALRRILSFWIAGCTFFTLEGIPILPCLVLLAELSLIPRLPFNRHKIQARWALLLALISIPLILLSLPALSGHFGSGRVISFLYFGAVLVPDGWKIATVIAVAFSGSIFLPGRIRHIPDRMGWIFVAAILVLCTVKGGFFWNHRLAKDPWVRDYYETMVWARLNTSREDMFILDPTLYGFRDHAQREYYFTWRNGFIVWQNPALYDDFVGRLNTLGVTLEELKTKKHSARLDYISNRFSQLTADAFLGIRAAHPRCKFVLYRTESRPLISFPVAYRNSSFIVCRIVS